MKFVQLYSTLNVSLASTMCASRAYAPANDLGRGLVNICSSTDVTSAGTEITPKPVVSVVFCWWVCSGWTNQLASGPSQIQISPGGKEHLLFGGHDSGGYSL